MQAFDKSRILVVGGAGFVGSSLVKELIASSSAYVLIVDDFLSAERFTVPISKRVDLIEGSITQESVLRQLPENLDYVFHIAGIHDDSNMTREDGFRAYGMRKFSNFLKGCRSLKKVIHVSGNSDEFELPHIFEPDPLPIVKATFQNGYGPGEILGAGRWRGGEAAIWRIMVPTFVYRAIKKLPLRIENGGSAVRDFIYVRDLARGLMRCAAEGEAGEAYHLASGEVASLFDLANMVNQLTKNPAPLELTPTLQWEWPKRPLGSTHERIQPVHFRAETSLRDGLRQTIEWTKANLPLIERCIFKHEMQTGVAA